MNRKFKNYLSFNSYKGVKNNDLLIKDDHLISHIEGNINVLRFNDQTSDSYFPLFSGMYLYFVLDLTHPNRVFNTLNEFIGPMDSIKNLINTYKEGKLDKYIYNHKRLVFLDYIIVKPEYRDKNIILSEFIKVLKRDYTPNNDETLILGNFQPIQYNKTFKMSYGDSVYDYILRKVGSEMTSLIDTSINDYFQIDKLDNDFEFDTLKLHSLAQKNGFNVISQENNIFRFF